jgi:hypothetical protein
MGTAMMDKEIVVRAAPSVRDRNTAAFDHALQALIAKAQGEGRTFLAYLLVMALMHLREENDERSGAWH